MSVINRFTKHGLRYKRIYSIWKSIKARCYNKNNESYYLYGQRGISMCKEWENNPKAFHEWSMSNGYKDNLTIDRKDNNKGYSPDNCQWITPKQQCRNRGTNRLITYNGETKWGKYFIGKPEGAMFNNL